MGDKNFPEYKNFIGTLRITLKSDLCPGSGYTFAGIIDTDVDHDSCGIPFISGRRIKGCMRDAAVLYDIMDQSTIYRLFGSSGMAKASALCIDNAIPADSSELRTFMEYLNYADDTEMFPEKKYLTQERVLNLYTSTRSQTKIDSETNTADDKTLRFTRVVNQYGVDRKSELVFVAGVEFVGTQKEWDDLEILVKAVRNIGMNRNRGLGHVKMTLEGGENNLSVTEAAGMNAEDDVYPYRKITYRIYNDQPLMLSGNQSSSSDNYVNGASVLGLLAGTYLKNGQADDEAFRDLFLKGKARFSDVIVTTPYAENGVIKWQSYAPAPAHIRRLKKSGKIVNNAVEKQWSRECGLDSAYNPNEGNQPKKLNGKFITLDNATTTAITEVKRNLFYHHSHEGKTLNGEEGLLYSSNAIDKGQYFAGEILVDAGYEDLVCDLLKNTEFRFGKSKSAQYGHCVLECVNPVVKSNGRCNMETLPAGKRIMVTFLSNGLFLDENGNYTVRAEEVEKILRKEIGDGLLTSSEKDEPWFTPCEITGYNTKWNLKKQAICAIAAGSSVSFTLSGDLSDYPEYVGERNLEGFGRIKIQCLDDMCYAMKAEDKKIARTEELNNLKKDFRVQIVCKEALKAKFKEDLAIQVFRDNKLSITDAALGRLILMVNEAVNSNPGDIWGQYMSLRMRMESIKDVKTRSKINDFLVKILGEDYLEPQKREDKEYVRTLLNESENSDANNIKVYFDAKAKSLVKGKNQTVKDAQIEEIVKTLMANETGKLLLAEFPNDAKNLVFSLAMEHFYDALVCQKYRKKGAKA